MHAWGAVPGAEQVESSGALVLGLLACCLSPASAWHILKELVTKKSRPVIRPGGMRPRHTENAQDVETELIALSSCLLQGAGPQQGAEGAQGEASNERPRGWPHERLSGSYRSELSWGSAASSDSGDAHHGSEGPTSPQFAFPEPQPLQL